MLQNRFKVVAAKAEIASHFVLDADPVQHLSEPMRQRDHKFQFLFLRLIFIEIVSPGR